MPGWKTDISGVRKWEDLPINAQSYCQRVEDLTGVHVKWVGVGPGRDALLEKPKGSSSVKTPNVSSAKAAPKDLAE